MSQWLSRPIRHLTRGTEGEIQGDLPPTEDMTRSGPGLMFVCVCISAGMCMYKWLCLHLLPCTHLFLFRWLASPVFVFLIAHLSLSHD